jgi:hypothetical protein
MKRFCSLWSDDAGFVISAELVLVGTILVIGLIVGLTSLRNQVVEELVDVGQAIGSLSQSYSYGGIKKCGLGMTDGGGFRDKIDFCQATDQTPGQAPGGISVSIMPSGAVTYPSGHESSW